MWTTCRDNWVNKRRLIRNLCLKPHVAIVVERRFAFFFTTAAPYQRQIWRFFLPWFMKARRLVYITWSDQRASFVHSRQINYRSTMTENRKKSTIDIRQREKLQFHSKSLNLRKHLRDSTRATKSLRDNFIHICVPSFANIDRSKNSINKRPRKASRSLKLFGLSEEAFQGRSWNSSSSEFFGCEWMTVGGEVRRTDKRWEWYRRSIWSMLES